jgi:hypothetical protein
MSRTIITTPRQRESISPTCKRAISSFIDSLRTASSPILRCTEFNFETVVRRSAGNAIALESLETTFHQDFNGDGTIGLVGTAIEPFGTSLLEVGNNYDLESISSGTGPELTRGGVAKTVGEYGSGTLIGVDQVAGGGYDVALENARTGQYGSTRRPTTRLQPWMEIPGPDLQSRQIVRSSTRSPLSRITAEICIM